jgi:hypothetical protein
MKELFPGTAVRDDFQRWLNVGYGPFTIWQGEKALVTISSLEKAPSVNYLYRISPAQDNSISWDNSLLFCGVYDTEHGSLYLTKDSLSAFTGGEFPPVSGVGPSVADEIGSRISQLVEDKSAGWKLGAILEKAAVKPSQRCSSFALASAPGESRTAAPTLSKSQTKSRYGRFKISSFLISGFIAIPPCLCS